MMVKYMEISSRAGTVHGKSNELPFSCSHLRSIAILKAKVLLILQT